MTDSHLHERLKTVLDHELLAAPPAPPIDTVVNRCAHDLRRRRRRIALTAATLAFATIAAAPVVSNFAGSQRHERAAAMPPGRGQINSSLPFTTGQRVDLGGVQSTMEAAVVASVGQQANEGKSEFSVEDAENPSVVTAATPASFDLAITNGNHLWRLFVSNAIPQPTGSPEEVCANRLQTGLALTCEVLASGTTSIIESIGAVTSEELPVGRAAIPSGYVRYDRQVFTIGDGPTVAFHDTVLSRPTDHFESLLSVSPSAAADLVTQPSVVALR